MRISNFIEDFFFLGLNDKVLFLTFENPIHDPLEVLSRGISATLLSPSGRRM